jgi:hypothetical protein
MKLCTKCAQTLPASAFNKANWLNSGLRSDCKQCHSKTKKAIWAAKPPSDAAIRKRENDCLKITGQRRCKCCTQIKSLTDFSRNQKQGHYETACRKCVHDRVKQWIQDNKERASINANVRCAKRYADKRKRTPPWLTPEQREKIKEVYAEARRLSRQTGKIHHVDHIYPLVGRDSSGLHVPWNLQILTGSENCKKSNKAPV